MARATLGRPSLSAPVPPPPPRPPLVCVLARRRRVLISSPPRHRLRSAVIGFATLSPGRICYSIPRVVFRCARIPSSHRSSWRPAACKVQALVIISSSITHCQHIFAGLQASGQLRWQLRLWHSGSRRHPRCPGCGSIRLLCCCVPRSMPSPLQPYSLAHRLELFRATLLASELESTRLATLST